MSKYTPDSIQCPACLLLKSTTPTSIGKISSILLCKEGGWKGSYKLLEGFEWFQGEISTNGLELGAGISTVKAIVAKTSDDKMEVNSDMIPPTPSCSTNLSYHPHQLLNQLLLHCMLSIPGLHLLQTPLS